MAPGDRVWLKTGGPPMTVLGSTDTSAWCAWDGGNAAFRAELLTDVDPVTVARLITLVGLPCGPAQFVLPAHHWFAVLTDADGSAGVVIGGLN